MIGIEEMTTRKGLVAAAAAVLLAFALGLLVGKIVTSESSSASSASAPTTPESSSGTGLFVCPMMDVPPMKQSGKCPVCGMDLVRVSGGDDDAATPRSSLVRLSAETVRSAGIRVAPVERRVVSSEIRLYGKIEYDPAHLSIVSAYMPGVVNRVYVERAGVSVRWGQPLFDFYSSDLFATSEQLFEAMQVAPGLLSFRGAAPHTARRGDVQERKPSTAEAGDGGDQEAALRKMNAIRHKLQILGLSKKDIDELQERGEPTGIATVTAPRAGVVIQRNALEATFVNTGSPLFTIADPRYIWLKLDAYESDLVWLKVGQKVDFQVEAYPGERFQGTITFIDPIFDAATRTIKVGVIAPEMGGKLKPEMIARGTIHATLGSQGHPYGGEGQPNPAPLVIPATAPLVTGKRAIAYVALPGRDGSYEGREIVLGPKAGEYYVVRDGLEEGEQVVVNGSFKIDSAAQILAKPSMMQPKTQ